MSPPPTIPDYELLRQIGRGSYGEVWLARNVFGEYRAVKVVYRQTFEHDRRYEREFAGIKKFEPVSRAHESQVDILHVGKNDAAGYFYYVMELADAAPNPKPEIRNPKEARNPNAEGVPAVRPTRVSGFGCPSDFGPLNSDLYVPRTLKHELRTRGALPFDECLAIAASLTHALEHLHTHGLVHRDIKPSNIIFVNGVPKLADIGLVTSLDATHFSYVGTDGFIAPEGPGTPQADLYSLGKVLYELSTGKDRLEFPELPAAWRTSREREGLLEFNAIILKACESDPAQRYPSAAAMLAQLAMLQSGRSVKRLQVAERRLAVTTKMGLAGAVVLLIAAVAYLLAVTQARRAAVAQQEAERLLYAADTRLAQQALEEGHLGHARALLAAHQPRSEKTDLRGFEWRYLWQQCQGDQFHVWQDHLGLVSCLAFSPDGRLLATGSRDRSVILWDLATRSKVATLTGHAKEVVAVAFAPDGETLATGSDDGLVRLWNWTSRQIISSFKGDPARLAYAPTGTRLAVGTAHSVEGAEPGTAVVWDYATGQKVMTLANSGAHVAYSPDGGLLATGSWKGEIRLWEAATGAARGALTNAGDVTALCFSPNGRTLAASNREGEIQLWEVATRRRVQRLAVLPTAVWCVAFSPDGRTLAAGSADPLIRLWDWASGAEINRLRGSGSEVRALAFSLDGRILASGGKDEAVMLWHPQPRPESLPPRVTFLGSASGKPVFSPTGNTFAAGSPGHQIALRDTATAQVQALLEQADVPLGFSTDGKFLHSLAGDSSLQRWDMAAVKLDATVDLSRRPKRLTAVGFSPECQLLARGYDDGVITLTRAADGGEATALGGHTEPIADLAFSPDGKLLASASLDKTARLWEAATGKVVATLAGHRDAVHAAAFSPDGQTLATGSRDETVRLWNVSTHEQTAMLTGHGGGAFGLGFSADGRTLVSGCGNGIITLTHVATGREVMTLKHAKTVSFAAFSPDGQTLISVNSDGGLRQWRAPAPAKNGAQ